MNKYYMTDHEKRQHGNGNNEGFNSFVCSKCYTRKPNEYLLKKHQQQHVTSLCVVCKKTFNSTKNLKRHKQIHEIQRCPECGKNFNSKKEFKSHKLSHKTKHRVLDVLAWSPAARFCTYKNIYFTIKGTHIWQIHIITKWSNVRLFVNNCFIFINIRIWLVYLFKRLNSMGSDLSHIDLLYADFFNATFWNQSILNCPRLNIAFPWSLLSWSALRWLAQILSRLTPTTDRYGKVFGGGLYQFWQWQRVAGRRCPCPAVSNICICFEPL